MDGVTSNVQTQLNEIKESVDSISDPYEINLTNLLSAEDSESISTAIGGIDNLNATVQDNRIIVGSISSGSVSVSIRILGNVTTLYYLLDSVVGLTLNEVKITNTSGTLSKSVTTHSVLTENMVINSLNSDETTLPLSAAQGKILATDKQDKTDDNLNTENKTIVGAINEILPKATGVGKIDPNSDGTGEVFNSHKGYNLNKASGNESHSEGFNNTASGNYSHAEGYHNEASGQAAHAEGFNNTASGNYSHAEGNFTVASGYDAHAEGKYNFDDSSAIHMVGIGTYSNRKSAHVIKSADGSHYIIGIGGYEGQATDSAQSLQEVVNGKQDTLTAGTGIEITPENQINVILDTTVFFVAETAPASPSEDQKKKICLVPADTSEEGNFYTEYVWVVDDTHPDGYWEEFGTYKSDVDLTEYLKTSDAESTYLKITDAESEYATKTELASKQNSTDDTLETTSKNIVGAINEVNGKSDVYVIDYLYIVGNAQNPDQELLDNALGGWDNLVNAIQTHKAVIAKQSFDGMEGSFSVVGSAYEPVEGGETINMLVQVSDINIYGIVLNRDSSDTVSVTIKPIQLNALDVLDVSTLFADSATITSELSSQIANYGKSSAPDFPVFNAGTSIGNIKPTWIRTSGGVTNFMCIADNKIWYFEIQGTTVQRASLAIS